MTPRFTGERHGHGELFSYDEARHRVAYRHALDHVHGKRVLDAGCGDGEGTSMLSRVATEAVGIDVSEEAIASCRAAHAGVGLRFEQRDLTSDLAGLGRFDVAVCFQVLEHVEADDLFLTRLHDVIDHDGVLLLTTPNARTSFSENPYHVREYTAEELREKLAQVFAHVEIVGVHGSEKVSAYERARRRAVERVLRFDPLRLRRFIPRRLSRWAFARLAVAVRRRVRTELDETFDPSDFLVSEERVELAVDLLAVCRP